MDVHAKYYPAPSDPHKGSGHGEKVPGSDTQRGLTDRQGTHTRCHCTQGKVLGWYCSREAHKRFL